MVRGGGSARPIALLLVRASLEAAQANRSEPWPWPCGGSEVADAVALWEASPCLLETATTAALLVMTICHSSACFTSSTASASAPASSPRLSLATVAARSQREEIEKPSLPLEYCF